MTEYLNELAKQATFCLLTQQSITVVHAADWKREGFPLPIKKMPADADGTTAQSYRPLAIFEYVHEVLSGEIAKRQANERATLKKEVAA